MPNTIDAQLALAAAYVSDGQRGRAAPIVASVWVNNFLDAKTEARILDQFGGLLTRKEHWARTVRLLMFDRAKGAERIMRFLSPAQKSLALARIAVSRRAGNAGALIDRVDPAYRDHPLFAFSRAQLAADKKAPAAAVKFLNSARGVLPEPNQWWFERRRLVRQLLVAGDAPNAYRAAAGFTDGSDGRLVDANLHAGWIALRFLNDPKTALAHFERQLRYASLPSSISSAQYWIGRAAEAMGDVRSASKAFTIAANYGRQYYGQLAQAKLREVKVDLRATPEWRSAKPAFDNQDLVRAVRLFAANGMNWMAEPLVTRLGYRSTAPGDLLLAARLAQEIKAHNLAIIIADIANRRGTALDLWAFPKDGLPPTIRIAEVDRAAVYAVARQESRFDVDALSRAGARGIMQLMPATAKETAKLIGVSYSKDRLVTDPAYNALLGSTYLARQLDRFDGSLVLAAAAYNAGASNVNKWLKANGDPRDKNIDPVDWIELIPFTETRRYVQKVMANYQIYRARLGDDRLDILAYLRKIPH
ncbi:MAG: lytic transglycosylase domain-containing protein [Alphaproteobacteria bacterium]|nr:lytic transglycosylase domain-containing protein [Alphaproteobacteria bacterium]